MAAYKRASKPHKKLLKEMIPTLDAEEMQELIRLLSKILDTTYDLRELGGDIKEVNIKTE
jgi:hypothetical protein